MAELDVIAPPKAVGITFSLEPAYNVIGSLSLFDMTEDFSGLNEWVYQTAKTLSPERLRTNQIALIDSVAHLADASWPSFPEWVDDLAAQDATAMRDHALQTWLTTVNKVIDREIPGASELLADRAAYLSLVEEYHRRKGKGESLDLSLWAERHSLLNDPPARQDLIVTHLRTMWDEVMAPEWERNLPMLEESVAAFESLGLTGLTAAEAYGEVIMRASPPPAHAWLEAIEHVIFIPSVHTGPYLVRLGGLSNSTVRLLFGARVPEGAHVSVPALGRSELLMRLNALADDTRLRILELLGHEGEKSTPDIIAQLEISQSAASRHLEHLTATGYLAVRRHEGANWYQLVLDGIDRTFRGLKRFCQ